ncbi:MAG: c-type cytochrome [Hydrogenophaga sp.]|nr:c-type cytochrome [Hydrogenophaga sp.]NIN25070.1 c-type cytochrome [Hydrogenophaga sp.]NIN29637.1 c-type cytochrome [Hydrogenophaga sp.]NIN54109.1 c-type cytochrome [Hydrogenophaga sp.]NIO50522.1 c-type cytochrome [Hydrogenophaga sp.]
MRTAWKATLASAAGALALAAGAAAFVWSGWYDVAATRQHTQAVYDLLEQVMRHSIHARAGEEDWVAPASDARLRGLRLYEAHCLQCHGAPGVAPARFALGMTPLPVNLVHTARQWTPAQIHWVVSEGIKMTGMPAWRFRLAPHEIDEVVAFVATLPTLSPASYQALAASGPAGDAGTDGPTEPDAETWPVDRARGLTALQQYACTSCHAVPGAVGSQPAVGPPLHGLAQRKYLAGHLPNSPDNLVRWIRFPQRVAPRSAMPDLGVSERDARDMAAYLLGPAAD